MIQHVCPSDSPDEVPSGSHWVLHQVDRSQTSCADNCPQGSTLRMEEHRLSFWDPKTPDVRKRHPIRESVVVQVVHRARNQAGVRLGRASLDKRLGQVCQQSLA